MLIDMWSSHGGSGQWESGVMGVVVLAIAQTGQAISSYGILNVVVVTI